MASSSGSVVSGHGGSSASADLAANSSLTATASEFVPNSTGRSAGGKFPKKTKNPRIPNSGFRNNAKEVSREPPNSGNGHPESTSEKHVGRGRYQSHQGNSSTYEEHAAGDGDVSSARSSRPSGRFSGKNYSGSRPNNRTRKEWYGQSGNNYGSGRAEEGAVGGEDGKTYFFKDNAPSYGRNRDRNGNGDQGSDQNPDQYHNDKPRYREGRDQGGNRSQKRELNAGFDRESDRSHDRPKYWERNRHTDRDADSYPDNASRESRFSDRNSGQRSRYGDRDTDPYPDSAQRDSRFSDRNSGQRGRYGDRETDPYPDNAQRDSRFSDRNSGQRNRYGDRDTDFYSENKESRFPDRGSGSNYDRGHDQYQDKYFSGRSNRRYADRYPERQRDDQSYERGFVNYDQNSRSYDRGYSSRGGRFESSREEQALQRSNPYQKGRSSTHNFNTPESFGSDNIKENGAQGREMSSFSRKDYEPRRNGDDVSQRERLTEQLSRGTLECLVCCDRVRQQDSVWSCSNCYHVLHLRCVMKWAKSSKVETGWRCPACQNVTSVIPSQYRCFCNKAVEPQWNRQDTPHTCGEVCGKSRASLRPLCVHRCSLLCHPGPCPPCVAQVTRECGCGKTSQRVKCGLDKPLLCESICDKVLNCGIHSCKADCHTGACDPCSQKIEQVCYCKKQSKEVDCVPENHGIFEFSCSDICGHELACGNHKCDIVCHEGKCKPCQLTPDVVTHCPCGQTSLSTSPDEKRMSCMDPIPTCGKICGRVLSCGQPSNPHTCKSNCHSGACPPCPLMTVVRCRCGYMDKELPCEQLTTKADDARCDKRCNKKRSCGKHKCNQPCCIEIDHPCPLPCNHSLTCGLHRCEQLCHRGHCQPCWRTSFEELYCECGVEVLYPPVPCGTKLPPCRRPCSREHDCEHPPLHNCHSEPNCPPCTVLTQKYCYGNHELRKSIPCHLKEFSCGLPCNKDLPCGSHKCIQLCHKGDCLRPGVTCTQPCVSLRPACQHPCSASCHSGSCPDIPCKEMVKVTCECGHRSAMRPCAENTKEYQRIATSLLASKMADVQLGHSIDIGDIMGNASTKKLYLKSLECNEECKVIERNRRMAIGLQIRNPDLTQKLTPQYSEFMRGWAKKDPAFCRNVHDKLTELVKLAKESKQKSRSYSFEVMNREKRQFVHEYCEHFGCESVAYDQEPKRNVVATAQKTKAWLPSVGLLEMVQREAGQRRVPGPMLNSVKKPVTRNMDMLASKWSTIPSVNGVATSGSSIPRSSSSQPCDEGGMSSSYIDHFNS
ncbi:hypothetical protein ONE63_007163 [Megalurothrips usitatus]|uniref:Protein shuttle craft n=1 Tax=Megalurothrips usitatus TaxID=439358 RepID=A0AAV7XW11_9NEOP|nr:hypothetical protein ONE63_007163 [Megalurothrips usitatus]